MAVSVASWWSYLLSCRSRQASLRLASVSTSWSGTLMQEAGGWEPARLSCPPHQMAPLRLGAYAHSCVSAVAQTLFLISGKAW